MSSDELESVTSRCHWEMSGAIMSLQAITGETEEDDNGKHCQSNQQSIFGLSPPRKICASV